MISRPRGRLTKRRQRGGSPGPRGFLPLIVQGEVNCLLDGQKGRLGCGRRVLSDEDGGTQVEQLACA